MREYFDQPRLARATGSPRSSAATCAGNQRCSVLPRASAQVARRNAGRTCGTGTRGTRAFTLIELSVVIIIIALISGILIVGVRHALSFTRAASERQFIVSLKMAVDQFNQQFGILPPLVDDADPIDTAKNSVRIAGEFANDPQSPTKFLCFDPTTDLNLPRYSELSIPIFILGSCTKDIDGVDGLGFTAVDRSAHFTKRGKQFEPLFAADREQTRLVFLGAKGEQTRLFDKFVRPRGTPIRYYRWLPTFYTAATATGGAKPGDIKSFNVPVAVGDPAKNGALRSAEYAVVGAGPNKVFGDEDIAMLRATLGADTSMSDADVRVLAASDNLVEVGK